MRFGVVSRQTNPHLRIPPAAALERVPLLRSPVYLRLLQGRRHIPIIRSPDLVAIGQLDSFSTIIVDFIDGDVLRFLRTASLPAIILPLATAVFAATLAIWGLIDVYRKGNNDQKGLIFSILLFASAFLFWSDISRKSFLSFFERYHIFLNTGG